MLFLTAVEASLCRKCPQRTLWLLIAGIASNAVVLLFFSRVMIVCIDDTCFSQALASFSMKQGSCVEALIGHAVFGVLKQQHCHLMLTIRGDCRVQKRPCSMMRKKGGERLQCYVLLIKKTGCGKLTMSSSTQHLTKLQTCASRTCCVCRCRWRIAQEIMIPPTNSTSV